MSTDKYILDANGEPQPASLLEWAEWFENSDARRVAHTVISTDPEVYVSTVFLGLDHGWGGGPPVLWETMVFGGPLDQEQERYTSRADAVAGHERLVIQARAAR